MWKFRGDRYGEGLGTLQIVVTRTLTHPTLGYSSDKLLQPPKSFAPLKSYLVATLEPRLLGTHLGTKLYYYYLEYRG